MPVSAKKVYPGSLKNLEKLLWNWIWLNGEMIKYWKGKDCPWWYNERASISTLVGAAWHTRYFALEEYASRKRKGRRSALGRCDLYFSIRNKEYVAEAKHCWLNAGSRAGNMEGNVQAYLDDACDDVIKNRPGLQGGEALLGITFVVPRMPPSDLQNEVVGERIKAVQNVLTGIAGKKCALAWIFPRNLRAMTADDDGYIYPGTAVLFKPVR